MRPTRQRLITLMLIKKLSLNKIESPFPFIEVMCLYNRLSGASITVRKSGGIPEPLKSDCCEGERLRPGYREGELLLNPKWGRFCIGKHALDRYIQYNTQEDGEIQRPMRNFFKAIAQRAVHPVELDDKNAKHKLKRYGPDDNAVHYRLGGSNHHVTAVPLPDIKDAYYVVTYFKREIF